MYLAKGADAYSPAMAEEPFKVLPEDEFLRMSLEERQKYMQRLMEDIRKK